MDEDIKTAKAAQQDRQGRLCYTTVVIEQLTNLSKSVGTLAPFGCRR
jgi:hypothetical protein